MDDHDLKSIVLEITASVVVPTLLVLLVWWLL